MGNKGTEHKKRQRQRKRQGITYLYETNADRLSKLGNISPMRKVMV